MGVATGGRKNARRTKMMSNTESCNSFSFPAFYARTLVSIRKSLPSVSRRRDHKECDFNPSRLVLRSLPSPRRRGGGASSPSSGLESLGPNRVHMGEGRDSK